MSPGRLSLHFTLRELTRSETATRFDIDNDPSDDPMLMRHLAEILAPGLERCREVIGGPLHVLSGYRCPALNSRVGGAAHSQHVLGLAADIDSAGDTARELARRLQERWEHVAFDQLILEYPDRAGWVHVSFPLAGDTPRRQVLTRTAAGYSRGVA